MIAVSGGALPSHVGKHQSKSALVESFADDDPHNNGSVADASLEKLLRSQKTRINILSKLISPNHRVIHPLVI